LKTTKLIATRPSVHTRFKASNSGVLRIAATASLLALAACKPQVEKAQAPPEPMEVGVVMTVVEDVPLTTELAGRTAAFETSQVRPQVSGIIQSRMFKEGAYVREGDTLYQIDSSIFEAAVAEARANLASAKATEENAQAQFERSRTLERTGAVSEQAFSDAQAALRSAKAGVAQTAAQLQTAEINLRFSTVPAPISGRIGRSLVTTGALASAEQADPLTTIQRLDPIFVDIQQSSTSLLSLRQALSLSALSDNSAEVHLKLEDGTDYPLAGTLQFTEVTVNPSTGSVTVRAQFPNPDGLLLPGMYVRATLSQTQAKDAVLVPQQSVVRNPRGEASALVVGTDDKVERRPLRVGQAIGNRWLVTDGLKAGERVVVEGTSKVKPQQTVKPIEVKPSDSAGEAAQKAAL
jgi:membrane fusion protein, multidrug efflux system